MIENSQADIEKNQEYWRQTIFLVFNYVWLSYSIIISLLIRLVMQFVIEDLVLLVKIMKLKMLAV